MKTCSVCKQSKATTDFYRRSARPSGDSRCKPCRDLTGKKHRDKYYTEHRDAVIGRARASILKSRYGLTEAQFLQMLEDQNGICAICGAESGLLTRKAKLAIDHDHATGAIRGLLCMSCNTALGNLRDDPALLRAAADYIETHQRRYAA